MVRSASRKSVKNMESIRLNDSQMLDLANRVALVIINAGDYANKSPNGKLSKTDYNLPGASAMATKQARAKNGRPFRPSKGEWPSGGSMTAMYGRGLRRWRESQRLTVVQAATKFGIPEANWYKIEAGNHKTTTAKQSEKISRAIKVSTYDVITLGRPESPDSD